MDQMIAKKIIWKKNIIFNYLFLFFSEKKKERKEKNNFKTIFFFFFHWVHSLNRPFPV